MFKARPSLLLDFVNSQQLDPRITFSRTSQATRINRNGNLEVVGAGVPRFDYEPADVPILGPELVTNGGFADATGWTALSATIDASNGSCSLSVTSAQGRVERGVTLEAGKVYFASVRIDSESTINSTLSVLRGAAGSYANIGFGNSIAAGFRGVSSVLFTAPAADALIQIRNNSGLTSGLIVADDVSVREVQGYLARKGGARGILMEEGRTNLLLNSSAFDSAPWSKTDLTVAPSTVAAPDGTTAFKLVESASYAVHLISQSSWISPDNSDYSASIYAKAGERSIFWVESRTKAPSFPQAWFDLASGTVLATANGATAKITPVGMGWYRCSITANSEAGTYSGNLVCGPAIASGVRSYAGNGTSGVYVWGSQLEIGPYSTSYIPTTGAQVSRSADIATINDVSSWYNQVEGTVVAHLGWSNGNSNNLQGNRIGVIFSDAVTGSDSRIYNIGGQAGGVFSRLNGTTPQVNGLPGVASTSLPVKVGCALQRDNAASAVNGLFRARDNQCLMTPVSKVGIGCSTAGGSQLSGHIRSIVYFPVKLSDHAITEMTK